MLACVAIQSMERTIAVRAKHKAFSVHIRVIWSPLHHPHLRVIIQIFVNIPHPAQWCPQIKVVFSCLREDFLRPHPELVKTVAIRCPRLRSTVNQQADLSNWCMDGCKVGKGRNIFPTSLLDDALEVVDGIVTFPCRERVALGTVV